MPNENAMTSTSGSIAHIAVHIQKRRGSRRRHPWPTAVAAIACEKIVGTNSDVLR